MANVHTWVIRYLVNKGGEVPITNLGIVISADIYQNPTPQTPASGPHRVSSHVWKIMHLRYSHFCTHLLNTLLAYLDFCNRPL